MAMIVDAFAGKLVEKLGNVIEEKAIMVLGVKDELQKLQRRMKRIACVLKDAERRRIQQDEAVKLWVDELKDFMYDAEDIIDLCMIRGTGVLLQDDHHSLPAESSSASKRVRCCNFSLLCCVRSVPIRYEIADKIKNLNAKLEEISEDKDKFNFIASSCNSSDAYVVNKPSSRQSSSLPEPDIVGWDIRDATKSLVELLVSPNEQKCRLFAIVGMGGIGKTTLAQQIYNDSKINDNFLLHSWIWVSKSSTSKTDLLKEIIRNAGDSYGESTTVAELQKILSNVLHGKSLFLVLDDVWDADVWIDLIKNPKQIVTTKCRVLVTTRDRNIAMKTGAVHIHNVSKLSSDFGWELLCNKVSTNNDESDMQRMKDIGMQIIEKCDGLPVAIKAIAGVLVTKDRNKREWENVLNSDAWTITGLPEELQGALYLSYEALPSTLKQCFLYCSLQPREVQREELIREWIAEGFIKPSGHASMEDVAKDYYIELIKRSFLQPNPVYVDMSTCTVHDLLRGLAQALAGDENFLGDPQDAQKADSIKKLRRLTVSSERDSVSIEHLDSLRRLSLSTPPNLNTPVIGSLKHLRLLILNGEIIENIPDSIGDLIHLRLLDLYNTSICELPESLGNLINLQFLLLGDCECLHNLPRSITKLCNLRHLNLQDTPLNNVPKGIGNLEHLNYLSGFIIGDNGLDKGEGCELEELQLLKNLSYLEIKNLEKARFESVSTLSNKPRLRNLILNCTPNTSGHIQQQEMDKIVQVLDELSPPPGLTDLFYGNFFGTRYPKWLTSSSIGAALPELTGLHLVDCCNCIQLPQLGQLPQLNYLKIEGATAVVSIGPEFLGNGEPAKSAFPKLEYLKFRDMHNWEEWSLISEVEGNQLESRRPLLFPRLIFISIKNCPRLKALPRGLNQASIQKLVIEGAHNLSRVSDLPTLRELQVGDCPILECVEKLDSLQRLAMLDEKNNSLPEWLISFLQQRKRPHDDQFHLHLTCTAQALKGFLKGRSYWVFLQQVPRLEAYAKGGNMYLKYTKEPYSYQTNLVEDIN
ncbi:P-loop containing nucleoside triphosphate hydrolase protein [Dioscorea alata]|uniref:P-loop containing nucleoside triphosphate hydrolase protein n=3 Tax=Dioscorea alata TaxID=55571 RepID=A0ACB7UI31_DIOAL|nr:P-loop containing nucleoside triphosphate hydrolase protein [Dioscorea alata]KAH7660017.1 P-loop containing nucleoside triphosphate hydrolase protein [Dioscorea alata]KAH7660018.1 P-loop containing nucleoside triphosphate hydrolase protein [Dioscorea alata]